MQCIIQSVKGKNLNITINSFALEQNKGESMDTDKEKVPTNKEKQSKPAYYRCTSCGVTVQCNGTPKVCPKCDNEKFYAVKK